MKHAYLIIAHNEFGLLRRLIQMIDDERNDIYIHIDKKVRDFDFDAFSKIARKSKVYFTKRIRVHWGHVSQVECEYLLFNAPPRSQYDYYHLLSGVDLPLVSQDEIHAFFEQNRGKEFVSFRHYNEKRRADMLNWVRYYRFLEPWERSPSAIKRKLYRRIFPRSIALQQRLGVDRLKGQDDKVQKGPNWISITDDFLQYVLKNEARIKRFCRFTHCPDEFFIQTLLYNSPFMENLCDDNLRRIDWARSPNGSSPYVFREEDYDMLVQSGCFWARKFSTKLSGRLPDMLYEHVMGVPAPDPICSSTHSRHHDASVSGGEV